MVVYCFLLKQVPTSKIAVKERAILAMAPVMAMVLAAVTVPVMAMVLVVVMVLVVAMALAMVDKEAEEANEFSSFW